MTNKILSLAAADDWVAHQRRTGNRIGFTCGAFDILHAGHVNLLERARDQCDRLLVAVNSDQSIRGYKNPLRPINPQEQRMQVLAALQCVDAVVLMEELRPARLIERWRPELYIKGGDYRSAGLRSAPLVESYGGEVVLLPFEIEDSTTAVIQRIEAASLYAPPAPASFEPAKILFVDRDGTLIENVPYLHEPSRLKLLPGVGDGLAVLQGRGFRIVMVTNQQGIGLGYYSLDDFFAVNLELFRQLASFQVRISRVAYCPHTLADLCECRKPAPGMLRSVLGHYRAAPSGCYMLGDSEADIAAGESIGCCSILIGSKGTAHHRVETFQEAVDFILLREATPAT